MLNCKLALNQELCPPLRMNRAISPHAPTQLIKTMINPNQNDKPNKLNYINCKTIYTYCMRMMK